MAPLIETVEKLSGNLAARLPEMEESANYYDSCHRLRAIGVGTPPEMRSLTAHVGWPRLYVDAICERLKVEGFRLAGNSKQIDGLWETWQKNSMDEESELAHTDALVYGRSYVSVSAPGPDDDDYPLIVPESPLNMIVDTDPRTKKVRAALRIYVDWRVPEEDFCTLYLPDATYYYKKGKGSNRWVADGKPTRHGLGIVPVVPLINRRRLSNPTGQSEITAELRSVTDAASRLTMNLQAAAELMAIPQRVLLGVKESDVVGQGGSREVTDAYYARYLAIESELAKVATFQAAELRNFTDGLQELAKQAASYTGLPPQYLSFATDNPASAEAIRSSESRLVTKCERKQLMFGGGWEDVMRLSELVMKKKSEDLSSLETVWGDAATPTYAAKADAATKLYGNGMGVIPKKRARQDIGYSDQEIQEMEEEDKKAPLNQLSSIVQAGVRPAAGATNAQGRPQAPAQTRQPVK